MGRESKVFVVKTLWSERDCSREGLRDGMERLNGDQLTRVKGPEEGL